MPYNINDLRHFKFLFPEKSNNSWLRVKVLWSYSI